jgi:hypothetical protein
VLAVALLPACGQTERAATPQAMRDAPPAMAMTPKTPTLPPAATHAPAMAGSLVATGPAWPPAAMQDADPRMRRFALEQWAREPTESLDVVTAAMVDPDESIRERAEQVFEDVLARRR